MTVILLMVMNNNNFPLLLLLISFMEQGMVWTTGGMGDNALQLCYRLLNKTFIFGTRSIQILHWAILLIKINLFVNTWHNFICQ